MEGKIFREKSFSKVSSPEQLNDYIRVAEPGVFLILAAVIVFLAGACIWGIFGRLDAVVHTAGECKDGIVTCYVKETDISAVQVGMPITVDGEQGTVTEIEETPIKAEEGADAWLLHLGGISEGEWVYPIKGSVSASDGIYETQITVESVSPMSFVWN